MIYKFIRCLAFISIPLLTNQSLFSQGFTISGTQLIDANGKEVAIPERIDRIAVTCQGGATHEITILGAGDKISAQPTMKAFPQLLVMFPEYESIVDPGKFDNVNIDFNNKVTVNVQFTQEVIAKSTVLQTVYGK